MRGVYRKVKEGDRMAGITGAGGARGVSPIEGAGAERPAVAADEGVGGATGPGIRTRARSLDMSSLGLAGDLEARLAAAEAKPAPQDLEGLRAHVAGLPRGQVFESEFTRVSDALDNRVKKFETAEILRILDPLEPADWLAMVDRLRATPSGEPGLSLLDKFIQKGVSERNEFIAEFADQVNRKLGLGQPTLEERESALTAGGMREKRADRVAGREVREASALVLSYYGSKDRQGFLNSLEVAAEKTGRGTADAVTWPFRKLVEAVFGIV